MGSYSISETKYAQIADLIANDFIADKTPLNDAVKLASSEYGMNHEQIRRLCEATNNAVFSKLFNSREKTAEDRYVEFEVADPIKVLGGYVTDASTDVVKSAEYLPGDLVDEMRLVRHVDTEDLDKVASDFQLRPESKNSAEKDIRTLEKVASHLTHTKIAADQTYDTTVRTLASCFSKLYGVKFEDFEKSAMLHYGEPAAVVLEDVRALRGLPSVTYNTSMIKQSADEFNPSLQEAMLLQQALKSHEESTQAEKALNLMKDQSWRTLPF